MRFLHIVRVRERQHCVHRADGPRVDVAPEHDLLEKANGRARTEQTNEPKREIKNQRHQGETLDWMRRPPAELLSKARVARLRNRINLGENGICTSELGLNLGGVRTATRRVRRQARDARPTDGLLQQVNSCSGDGDGWHDRNAEDLAELADVDATAAFIEFIHQIQYE